MPRYQQQPERPFLTKKLKKFPPVGEEDGRTCWLQHQISTAAQEAKENGQIPPKYDAYDLGNIPVLI